MCHLLRHPHVIMCHLLRHPPCYYVSFIPPSQCYYVSSTPPPPMLLCVIYSATPMLLCVFCFVIGFAQFNVCYSCLLLLFLGFGVSDYFIPPKLFFEYFTPPPSSRERDYRRDRDRDEPEGEERSERVHRERSGAADLGERAVAQVGSVQFSSFLSFFYFETWVIVAYILCFPYSSSMRYILAQLQRNTIKNTLVML